tara:strand:- start:141 stop:497 length:357 start_codon:yes stop_codon:yes gene_type:complete
MDTTATVISPRRLVSGFESSGSRIGRPSGFGNEIWHCLFGQKGQTDVSGRGRNNGINEDQSDGIDPTRKPRLRQTTGETERSSRMTSKPDIKNINNFNATGSCCIARLGLDMAGIMNF